MTRYSTTSLQFAVAASILFHAAASAKTPVSVSADAAAITNVLSTSAKAWAKGDLDGFMMSYEDSPRTTYITGKDALHGFAAVRAVYAPRLTGPGSNPGELSVKVDTVEPLGPNYALTVGHFRLTSPTAGGRDSSGIFTLIFHRTSKGWRIISDHTS